MELFNFLDIDHLTSVVAPVELGHSRTGNVPVR